MSKLKQLMKELCPNELEYEELGKIATSKRGKSLTSKNAITGNIPVISGGLKPAFYHNESNRNGESVVVAGSGINAGFISYWNIPVFVSDAFTISSEKLLPKFLYYCLANKQEEIFSLKKGAGIPHVYFSDLAKIKVPTPPPRSTERNCKNFRCYVF